jgi:RHS repeat-associated protein
VAGTTETLTYDAHGNCTRLGHLPALRWDAFDRLREVDLNGGGRCISVHDANGQLVRKVVEGPGGVVRSERVHLGSYDVFRRFLPNGSVTLARDTVHVGDDRASLALVERRTVGDDGTPARLVRYQHANHQASIQLELDGAGEVVSYEEYHPYGSTSFQSVGGMIPARKRLRFAGKERDDGTGLYDVGDRQYAPWLCRWVAPDPGGIGDGPNVYLYVHANPVLFVDDTGTDADVHAVMQGLVEFRALDPIGFERFLIENEKILYPVLSKFGYTGCFVNQQMYVTKFDEALTRYAQKFGYPKIRSEVLFLVQEREREQRANEVILAPLPDGTGYIGKRSDYERAVQSQQAQRAVRTLDNIRSGIFGAVGYALGGDQGSDVGAAVDGLATAAAGTANARAYNKALSNAPPERPAVTVVQPRGNSSSGATTPRGAPAATPVAARVSPPAGPRANGLTSAEAVELANVRTSTFNLPPQPTNTNTRIVGVLVLDTGERLPIHSGKFGGPYGGTHRGGIPRGLGSGYTRHILTHVEGHAVAIMHQRGIQNATLLIERAPCGGCDNPTATPNITAILPRGATLTVVDPQSASVYRSSAR